MTATSQPSRAYHPPHQPTTCFSITYEGMKNIEAAVNKYNEQAQEEYEQLPTARKVSITALDIIKTVGSIAAAVAFVTAIVTVSMLALSISAFSFAVALLCDKLNPGIPLTELTSSWQKVHKAISNEGDGESVIEALKQFQEQKEQKNSRYDKIVEKVHGNCERILNSMWVMGYLLLAVNKVYEGNEESAKSHAILALNKYSASELFDKNGADAANLARLIINNAGVLMVDELRKDPLNDSIRPNNKIAHIDSLINACHHTENPEIKRFFRASD